METLIIHKGDKGHFADIIRSDRRISIGRAYHNDLVLADPYVAAEQAVIEKCEDGWQLQVLEQTNPVLLNGHPVEHSAAVASGDVITLGRSKLPLFSDAEPVEETRKLILSDWLLQNTRKPYYALISLCLTGLLLLASLYLERVAPMDWKEGGLAIFVVFTFILLWSAFWALIGKLVLHKGQFSSQLFATSIAASLSIALDPSTGYLEYASNSANVGLAFDYVIGFLVLTLLFKLNLMFASNLKHSGRFAALLAVLALGSTASIDYFQQSAFSTSPVYLQSIKPPFVKLQGDLTVEQYFSEVQQAVVDKR